jgi:hypothetical protein
MKSFCRGEITAKGSNGRRKTWNQKDEMKLLKLIEKWRNKAFSETDRKQTRCNIHEHRGK